MNRCSLDEGIESRVFDYVLLTNFIDLVGHVLRHKPQPKHFTGLKTSVFESSSLASNWQRWTQVPQLLHVSLFC